MIHARHILLLAAIVLAGCASPRTAPHATPKRDYHPAQERPGLGTSWGEQRESWVEPAPFRRASPERPSATAGLFYNDREGVDAMLDFLGGEAKRRDGLQPCDGTQLRIGLRSGGGAWLDCHESRGRRIAVGEPRARYEVVLKNEARRAVEVVVSVDGLDVLDGKPASVKRRGYVLAPFETVSIEGFRTSAATVAAFRFGSMTDSYGHRRHGSSTNAGVIGLAVFEESRRPQQGGANDTDRAWRFTATRPDDARPQFSTPPEA